MGYRVAPLRFIDLFAGIGGFRLALDTDHRLVSLLQTLNLTHAKN